MLLSQVPSLASQLQADAYLPQRALKSQYLVAIPDVQRLIFVVCFFETGFSCSFRA